ncbi:MAG: hypothetical protein ACI841_000522 [Planctomycetota bacterium]|jgi:hypothetical protein
MRLKSIVIVAALIYALLWLTILPPMHQLRRTLATDTDKPVAAELDITLDEIEGERRLTPEDRVRLDGGEFKAPEQVDRPGASRSPRGPRNRGAAATDTVAGEPEAGTAEGEAGAAPAIPIALLVVTVVDERGTVQTRGKARLSCTSDDQQQQRVFDYWFSRQGLKGTDATIATEEGALLNKDGQVSARVPAGIELTLLSTGRRGERTRTIELGALEANKQHDKNVTLTKDGNPPASEESEADKAVADLDLALLHVDLTNADGEPIGRARVRLHPGDQPKASLRAISKWSQDERTKSLAERLLGDEGVNIKNSKLDLILPVGVELVIATNEFTRRSAKLVVSPLTADEKRNETLVLLSESEKVLAERSDRAASLEQDMARRRLGWIEVEVINERTGKGLPGARVFLSPAASDSNSGEGGQPEARSLSELKQGIQLWVADIRPDGPEEDALGENGALTGKGGRLTLGVMPKVAFTLTCSIGAVPPIEVAIPELASGGSITVPIVIPDPTQARWSATLQAGEPPIPIVGARVEVGEEVLGKTDSNGHILLYFEGDMPAEVNLQHQLCKPMSWSPNSADTTIAMEFHTEFTPEEMTRIREAVAAAESTRARRAKREERLEQQDDSAAAATEEATPRRGANRDQGAARNPRGDAEKGNGGQAQRGGKQAAGGGKQRPPKPQPKAKDGRVEMDVLRALGVIKDIPKSDKEDPKPVEEGTTLEPKAGDPEPESNPEG